MDERSAFNLLFKTIIENNSYYVGILRFADRLGVDTAQVSYRFSEIYQDEFQNISPYNLLDAVERIVERTPDKYNDLYDEELVDEISAELQLL